ncbi:hypothetical protein CUJ83_13245 [Methanocella sp. CWC-04]|uniref:histidine kinase n=1 Tax=Methanooceanicella nereidis TaxID=2052831 RepID=A0AAP2W733_9EURY|nr:GAF domain-containing protein [Methanocella sp. CWC-04]MCD1295962.1 hypothetical protein [Methanocella sp. CWC-04]
MSNGGYIRLYKQFEDIFEHSAGPVFIFNELEELVYHNLSGKSLLDTSGKIKPVFAEIIDVENKSLKEIVENLRSGYMANPVESNVMTPTGISNYYMDIWPAKYGRETFYVCYLNASRKECPDVISRACESFYNESSDAMLIIDCENYTFINVNKRVEDLCGHPSGDLKGKSMESLYPPDDTEKLIQTFKRLIESGGSGRDRVYMKINKGKVKLVEITSKKMSLNGRDVIIALVTDISELENAAVIIKRRNNELSALNDISATINSTLDLDVVLESSLNRSCEVTGMQGGCIYLLDKDTGKFTPSSCMNMDISILLPIDEIDMLKCIDKPALRGGSPVVVDTSEYSGEACRSLLEAGIRTVIYVPIIFQGQLLGIMNLAEKSVRHFTEEDLTFFTSIANTIGIAINNARYVKDVSSQAKKFSLLFKTTGILTSTLDLEEVLELFAKNAAEVAGTETCAVYFLDKKRNRLNIKAVYGTGPEEVGELLENALLSSGIISDVIETKSSKVVEDTSADPELSHVFLDKYDIRSFLCTPLVYHKDVTGVILLFTRGKQQEFSSGAIDVIENLADQAAQAIENAKLVDDLRKRNDELRRVFDIQRKITQSINIGDTLNVIVENVPYLIKLPYCVIFLIDEEHQEITSVKATKAVEMKHGKLKFRMDELVASRIAMDEMRPLVIENARDFPKIARPIVDLLDMKSTIILPLIARGKKLGVMWLYTDEKPVIFEDEDVRRAIALSDQAAVSIDNARLFRELSSANDQLESSYEKLKDLDKMKMEFFTLISHELRTPLTTIKGFTELLHDGLLGPINEKQRDKLDKIKHNVDKLSDVVTSLSDLSSITSKKYSITMLPMALDELIREVVRSISFLVEEKKIKLSVDVPVNLPLINADREKIQQVLLNIINNAIKYTPPGGEIAIKAEDRENDILVSIRDTGIGIPKSDLEKIFTGFYHSGYKLSYEYKGMGLGLALSKGIIESHGGRIWAESELGKWSTFYFTLPKYVTPIEEKYQLSEAR